MSHDARQRLDTALIDLFEALIRDLNAEDPDHPFWWWRAQDQEPPGLDPEIRQHLMDIWGL